MRPDFQAIFHAVPRACLIFEPDLTIVAASDLYLPMTQTTRKQLIGRKVFEVFPAEDEDQRRFIKHFHESVQRVSVTRKPDQMPIHKYNIKNDAGKTEQRYWSVQNAPVFVGPSLTWVINAVEDVTRVVTALDRVKSTAANLERLNLEIAGAWTP